MIFEVVFRIRDKRRFLVEASGEDEACERAEEQMRKQMLWDGADIDLLDVRPAKRIA